MKNEAVNDRYTGQLNKDDVYYRILVRGGSANTDGCGTLYMKNATEVLRARVELRKIYYMTFHT